MALPLVANIPYCTFNHNRKPPATHKVAWSLKDVAECTHPSDLRRVLRDALRYLELFEGEYKTCLLPTLGLSDQVTYSSSLCFYGDCGVLWSIKTGPLPM